MIDARLTCLLAQALVSGLIALHLRQAAPGIMDADVFGPGGWMLLEVLRLKGPMLARAAVDAGSLVLVALPLLVLVRLRLLEESSRPALGRRGMITRRVLDAYPAHFLIHIAGWGLTMAVGWGLLRTNAVLWSQLTLGLQLERILVLCVVNALWLAVVIALSTAVDHLKLSGLLGDRHRAGWHRRLREASLACIATPALAVYRLLRLVLAAALFVASGLLHATFQRPDGGLPSWTVLMLTQLLVYLAIVSEAWWYRALAERLNRPA